MVKHRESRRPKSWKSESITRSKQDAIELILKFRKEILGEKEDENRNENENEDEDENENKNGDKNKENEDKSKEILSRFIELSKKESDCNSYKRGGDLGPFGKGRMQKPFEDAAFALNIGQLSEPVETDSGIHLILRYD